ncbi:hypothetical protein GOBAR_DD36190 [Gossypium barbadense]|nr:hypothetical protein GOBAR_DD36190 [Gossypium barbadense]
MASLMAIRRGRSSTPPFASLLTKVRLNSSHFTSNRHFDRTQILSLSLKSLSTSAIPNEYQRPPPHHQNQQPPPSSDPRVFHGQRNPNFNNQWNPQNQGYHHPQQQGGVSDNNQWNPQQNQGQGYSQRGRPNQWNPQQNRSYPETVELLLTRCLCFRVNGSLLGYTYALVLVLMLMLLAELRHINNVKVANDARV